MPEVPVEGTLITVLVHQRADIAQVAAQFFRRYCGVIPSFPLRRGSRCEGCRPRPGLPQLPDMARFGRRVEASVWCIGHLL